MSASGQPMKTVIDGVECVVLTRPHASKTVMMLHGFGADMNDLAPLHSYIDPDGQFNWIFPNGLLEVPIGPHSSGRAWFPIRMSDIEAAAMRGEVVDFAESCPEGMINAENRVSSLIEKLRIAPKDLILGGFSQGAMMTCQIALSMNDDIAGMILFSGNCLNFRFWQERAPLHKSIPFIQSHGQEDPILGFKHAERLYRMLSDSGLRGKFIPFKGFHEIPLPVIRETTSFLKSL